jgi:predicted TIM-barrel fold metal-dependent hydrolase
MMSALNDWMMAEWLDQDPRCAGAISLPFEDPLRSVVEIERLAPDHRWGKIMLPGKTREGLGHAKYWSIYEAACNYDIPVSIHVGGFSGSGPGPLFNYFLEHQVSYTMDVQAQVASLVCGGVFERFPTLRVALEETTIGWLPPFIWRFDRSWALLRLEAPISLQEPPSSVIRRHFWIATQPLDSPADIRELQEMFRHLNMDDHVLFSTDYPHWNFDDPNRVLPASSFDSEFRAKVLFDNARALLGKRGEIDG